MVAHLMHLPGCSWKRRRKKRCRCFESAWSAASAPGQQLPGLLCRFSPCHQRMPQQRRMYWRWSLLVESTFIFCVEIWYLSMITVFTCNPHDAQISIDSRGTWY